jgi:hypothetical protein
LPQLVAEQPPQDLPVPATGVDAPLLSLVKDENREKSFLAEL